jgi:hypothetical protein
MAPRFNLTVLLLPLVLISWRPTTQRLDQMPSAPPAFTHVYVLGAMALAKSDDPANANDPVFWLGELRSSVIRHLGSGFDVRLGDACDEPKDRCDLIHIHETSTALGSVFTVQFLVESARSLANHAPIDSTRVSDPYRLTLLQTGASLMTDVICDHVTLAGEGNR